MTIDGTPLEDEEQSAVTFSAGWDVGARSELVISAERAKWTLAASDERDLDSAGIAFNHSLGSRTELVFQYRRSKENSGEAGFPTYAGNTVSLLATRTF
jgi:hypothetical protein